MPGYPCRDPCLIGQHLQANNNCITCPTGTVYQGGTSSCSICAAGYYGYSTGPWVNATCTLCPAGKFSAENSTSCTDCPAGYVCPNQGTSEAEKNNNLCPPGTYAPAGSPSCLDSPAGAWSGRAFANFVTNTIGYYSGSRSGTQRICPPGSYCPPNAVEPIQCPSGTFGSSSGLSGSNCSGQCPTGTFCGDSGHATPMECKAELE